jgi:hypothetical protein
MRKTLFVGVLLLGASIVNLPAQAQQTARGLGLQSADLAVTYGAEAGKVAASSNSFWMQGGSIDTAVTLFRGLGLAANLSGERASDVSPGADVNRITFVAGPRYSFNVARLTERWLGPKHPSSIFGQTLFGTVHAFNGLFPHSDGTLTSSANAFAMQVGGGINVGIARGFGVRIIEVEYLYTTLPNNGTNTQHDLRLTCGVAYHIGRR